MARKSRKNVPVNVSIPSGNLTSQAVMELDKETKPYQVAVYARLSHESEANRERDTVETQISYIKNYVAEQPDMVVVDIYADVSVSGTTFERPEFERMMQDVRTGKIQCIVVKDLSRFGRDYIETGSYLETIFPMLHVRFIAINDRYDNELVSRLEGVAHTEFVRLPYTEGIKILEEAIANGTKFEYPVGWGTDLQSEHERYLVEQHFKKPVILTDYPKDIKAFYMKQNEDGKTVRAMDVLFPKIGEIIGGSEREASLEKLERRIDELGMSRRGLEWYIDTRRFGSAPHSGFGLGFERLLLFVTGMSNIRDVIPFPRTPKNAEY